MAVTALNAARGNAKLAKAQHEIDQITTAIRFLENDSGQWPDHQPIDVMCRDLPGGCPAGNELCDDGCTNDFTSGYAGITQDDSSTPYNNWSGPYMSNIPQDPWGNDYFFDTDYDHPDRGWVVVVGSYGPNGIGFNLYDSDDIVKILR